MDDILNSVANSLEEDTDAVSGSETTEEDVTTSADTAEVEADTTTVSTTAYAVDETPSEDTLVDGDTTETTDEVIADDNTETQEIGTDVEEIQTPEPVADETIPTEETSTTEVTGSDSALVEQFKSVDTAPLKKAELYPTHKDDPNYYYDGHTGVYKEKDPNYNYNADGTITRKSANDN